MRYLQIQQHEESSIKEKSPNMIVTKRRVTKLVAPVILVVVRSLGDRAKDRRYQPGRVTLRVTTYQRHTPANTTTVGLCGHTRRNSAHIPCKRHKFCSSQWRQLSDWTKSKKQSRWTFFPVQWRKCIHQQWSPAQHGTYHQACDVISNQSCTCSTVHHVTRSSLHQNHIRRDGSRKATNSTINRQFNGRCCV